MLSGKKTLFKIGICVWKVKSCLEVDLDTSCHVFKNVGSEEWGHLRYIASCRGKAWLLRQPKQTVKPTWKSSWEVLTEDVHNYTRLTYVCAHQEIGTGGLYGVTYVVYLSQCAESDLDHGAFTVRYLSEGFSRWPPSQSHMLLMRVKISKNKSFFFFKITIPFLLHERGRNKNSE